MSEAIISEGIMSEAIISEGIMSEAIIYSTGIVKCRSQSLLVLLTSFVK